MALLNIQPAARIKITPTGRMRVVTGYGYGGGGGGSLSSGLQAFYRLSDTSDSSGNGNTLTNNGGVTFSSGKIGNAASFNNTSKWLSRGDLTFSNKTEVSFSLWLNGPNQSGAHNAFSTGTTGSNNNGFGIYADTSNQLLMLPWNKGTLGYTKPFVANQWFHLAITFLKNGITTTVKYYVNGSLESTKSTSNAWFGAGSGDGILIGRSNEGQNFGGLVDAVGVWDRTLTTGEISDLYNTGAGIEL